jgi:chemotaxis signal transduction protein
MDCNGVNVPDPSIRPTRPWCLFECGRTPFAVALDAVAEVVEVERLVRLPDNPPRVLGVCTLRREVIPVIDLRDPGAAWPGADTNERLVLVILKTARGTWAIRIDTEGTAVATEALDEPARPATEGSGLVFLGSIRRAETAHAVIDPEATWQRVRTLIEDWYCERRGRDKTTKSDPSFDASRAG